MNSKINDKIFDFYRFAFERQSIWHRRNVEKMTYPWTNDEILQRYQICNVFRQLDKGTQYIINKVLKQNIDNESKIFNAIIYRLFNLHGLFEHIFYGLVNPKTYTFIHYEKELEEKKKKGQQLFHCAYLVNQHPYNRFYRPREKHIQILLILEYVTRGLKGLAEYISKSNPTDCIKGLTSVPKIGDFLGGQILLDLSYAGIPPFNDDFCIVGPGATYSLQFMFDTTTIVQGKLQELCKRVCEEQTCLADIGNWNEIVPGEFDQLSLGNIEHSLGAYSRYLKLKTGTGKGRRYKR